jgi:hypothetical protein
MRGVLLWFAALCACALLGWANYRRSQAVARRLLDLRVGQPPAPAPEGCGARALAEASAAANPSGAGSLPIPAPRPAEGAVPVNER